MASSDAAITNSADKLSTSVPSPEISDNSNVSKKNRRQRRKAAKPQAAKPQAASPNPTDTGPSPSKNAILVMDNKPKNWEASLTIAEIKALRYEEATKKHNQQFPPRAKRDTTTTKPKNSRQGSPVPPKAEPAEKPKSEPVEKCKPGRAEKPKPVDSISLANADRSAGIRYEQPLPPCGIRGCPVRDNHERRPYVFNEDGRPAMIKMIQNKAGKATEADWRTLDRFFHLHKHVGKPAKVKAQA